jgi:hypothetical protein
MTNALSNKKIIVVSSYNLNDTQDTNIISISKIQIKKLTITENRFYTLYVDQLFCLKERVLNNRTNLIQSLHCIFLS